jgi:tellurite resistance protein TerC
VIEKSLAVDNIFVFAVIFSAFSIPPRYQHRVLFWGVIGALALRAVFIAAGIAMIERFHWTIYLLGAVLVVTAWRLLTRRGNHLDPSQNRLIAWLQRRLPMTDRLDGQRFMTMQAGRRVATPLLAALIAVEVSDVVFAVDSIPAVFAVTSDPFLVFSSNAFAILGLRSMYFLLAGMLERLELLSVGLAVVLAFVGLKMMLSGVFEIPILLSLGVIVIVLAVSVVASLHRSARRRATDGFTSRS